MSDLQCAARILVSGGTPHVSAEELAAERVLRVWTDPESEAAARELAALLGVGVDVREDLAGGLEEVADVHRGETVLALCSTGSLGSLLPSVAAELRDSGVVAVHIDADGWAVSSWQTGE